MVQTPSNIRLYLDVTLFSFHSFLSNFKPTGRLTCFPLSCFWYNFSQSSTEQRDPIALSLSIHMVHLLINYLKIFVKITENISNIHRRMSLKHKKASRCITFLLFFFFYKNMLLIINLLGGGGGDLLTIRDMWGFFSFKITFFRRADLEKVFLWNKKSTNRLQSSNSTLPCILLLNLIIKKR